MPVRDHDSVLQQHISHLYTGTIFLWPALYIQQRCYDTFSTKMTTTMMMMMMMTTATMMTVMLPEVCRCLRFFTQWTVISRMSAFSNFDRYELYAAEQHLHHTGWTRGVQVKPWDPLRTPAIPERLRGVFTTRRYKNPHLGTSTTRVAGVQTPQNFAKGVHGGPCMTC